MEINKETVEAAVLRLIENNEANANEDGDYSQGYYEGVHDALVDVLNQLQIPTDEEYFN